jgi:sulfite reductase alpha subunit-like flavoprotein
MQPRYYSIASSPLAHPHEVYLTYRPVKYVTSKGHLREGVCTSYMSTLGMGDTVDSFVIAAVRSNPTFRLPKDPKTPVLLIAGGCGIAPIRAFLEERIEQHKRDPSMHFGPSYLFLGFRSPADEAYRDLVDQANAAGLFTDFQITYSSCGRNDDHHRCGLVSEALRDEAKLVYDLVHKGGHMYLCGGARTFGVAIEQVLLDVFQEQGKLSLEEATEKLQTLIHEGRLCEDLAD